MSPGMTAINVRPRPFRIWCVSRTRTRTRDPGTGGSRQHHHWNEGRAARSARGSSETVPGGTIRGFQDARDAEREPLAPIYRRHSGQGQDPGELRLRRPADRSRITRQRGDAFPKHDAGMEREENDVRREGSKPVRCAANIARAGKSRDCPDSEWSADSFCPSRRGFARCSWKPSLPDQRANFLRVCINARPAREEDNSWRHRRARAPSRSSRLYRAV